MKKIVTLLLVSVMLFTMGFSPAQTSIVKTNSNSYTSEELFRGIFFAQGEVGKKLTPKVFNAEIYEFMNSEEAITAGDEIILKIKEKSPTFFDDFKALVTTHNPKKVQEALAMGSKMLLSFYEDEEIAHSVEDDIYNPAAAIVFVVGLVVVFYAAAIYQVAVGAAYVAAGGVYYYAAAVQTEWGAVSKVSDPTSGLSNEIYIAEIIKSVE